ELDARELKFAQDAIKQYDQIKDIIWQGDLYRFANPREVNYASMGYVNKDQTKAVMFNYLTEYTQVSKTPNPIIWNGLAADKNYKVTEINLYQSDSSLEEDLVLSGDFLMKVGIN